MVKKEVLFTGTFFLLYRKTVLKNTAFPQLATFATLNGITTTLIIGKNPNAA